MTLSGSYLTFSGINLAFPGMNLLFQGHILVYLTFSEIFCLVREKFDLFRGKSDLFTAQKTDSIQMLKDGVCYMPQPEAIIVFCILQDLLCFLHCYIVQNVCFHGESKVI
jgi:hypothetical protein